MKKLISLLTSITLCVGAMSALPANAFYAVVHGNIHYEESKELEEYFGISEKSNTKIYVNSDGGTIYSKFSTTTGVEIFSSFGLAFSYYDHLTQEEVDIFTDFIQNNYHDITISTESYTVKGLTYFSLVCNNDFTFEEQFKLAVDIKNNTGLICSAGWYEDWLDVEILGDLSSDNALTPVDASMLLSYYADAQSGVAVASAESDADYSVLGDFNGDGAVTPSDASEILSYYADQQTAQ